jgi:hypothetical protein
MTINRLNNSNTSISCFSTETRFNEIKSKIKLFEGKMGVEKSVELALGEFNTSPCAVLQNNTIKLPTWFLFKYDDIPVRFRVVNLDDPRIADNNFLNELAGWMNARFQEAGISSVIRPADHGILQTVIKKMRDQNLYEKCKDFTLCHELSHLNHSQIQQRTYYLNGVQEIISVSGVIGSILLLFLAVAIIPFVELTVTLVVGGIATTVSILAILAWLNRAKPSSLPSFSAIEEEKHADLDAIKTMQDASGGIYLFETYRQQNQAVRRSDPTQMHYIDEHGNNLKDKNHPPLTERIAYLRQWQAQHFQRAWRRSLI